MYPLKFENLYYPKIWGGREFSKFRDNVPNEDIGESWDVACHRNGMSIVKNGKYKGKSLKELIDLKKEELLGCDVDDEFPLLVKLINSNKKLSIQVHPSDQQADTSKGESGKVEAWYVIEASKGANLSIGFDNDYSKEQIRKAIKTRELEKYINNIKVKKGDMFFIDAGTVHSIGEGVVIAEIQQNSDTTFRLHDFERNRELHVQEGLKVIDISKKIRQSEHKMERNDGYCKSMLCECEHFTIEKFKIDTRLQSKSNTKKFHIYTCVEGGGIIISKEETVSIKKGDSVLIPATMGVYEIKGQLEVLKSYVS